MSVRSELHLIVPGLSGPLAEIQPLKENQDISKWVKCLSQSTCTASVSSAYEVISSLLDIPVTNNCPSAALSMLAYNVYDDSLSYMCADPVHLQADLDHAILTSSKDLFIKKKESDGFCESLNQHFNQDGLAFTCLDESQWIVTTKDEIDIDTTPLSDAVGRNINFILPKGESSSAWKRTLTEAQMLMHSHDINTDRGNAAQLSINSLWFHGAGKLPVFDKANSLSMCSDNVAFKGLARHVACNYMQLPASAEEYIEHLLQEADRVNVLHLDELEHLVNYSDVNIWLEKMTDVLHNWIYPLIKMMHKNNVKVVLYPCNEKQYQFSKHDALKFWRQGNLEQHVSKY